MIQTSLRPHQATNGAMRWLSEQRRFRGVLRRPYLAYKALMLSRALADDALLSRFRQTTTLPEGYGVGVDERCIELPWMMAQLAPGPGRVIDAGSALNHPYLVKNRSLAEKTLHILTLAPERRCFWRHGISYMFADLRDIPVRDGYYDSAVCVSTLEHVGCDNSAYTGNANHREDRRDDIHMAMRELARVLRPGGELLLTVPFGSYRHLGWMRNFDRPLLSRTLEAFTPTRERTEAFYLYDNTGWQLATDENCAAREYAVHRSAAASVACIRVVKA